MPLVMLHSNAVDCAKMGVPVDPCAATTPLNVQYPDNLHGPRKSETIIVSAALWEASPAPWPWAFKALKSQAMLLFTRCSAELLRCTRRPKHLDEVVTAM